jgi:hypothetical protein
MYPSTLDMFAGNAVAQMSAVLATVVVLSLPAQIIGHIELGPPLAANTGTDKANNTAEKTSNINIFELFIKPPV